MPTRRLTPRLRALQVQLDELLQTHDVSTARERDPVGFVHRFDDADDQEVVGLIASMLAFGQLKTVRARIGDVLDILGPSPAQRLAEVDKRWLNRKLRRFVHRVYRGKHVATVLFNAAEVRRSHGTLGRYFEDCYNEDPTLRHALIQFADTLRGPAPERGLAHLIPDPRGASACKRLLLYLRWMCRPADGVDLGLWSFPASELIIPVDTHIQRISQLFGLTRRKDASWRTAEDITTILRRFDPHDPIKYDFAICHLGISKQL